VFYTAQFIYRSCCYIFLLSFFTSPHLDLMTEDHYSVLGISQTADFTEIRRAYKVQGKVNAVLMKANETLIMDTNSCSF
jgi:DnaJ-domain-containing protein 1